MDKKLEGRIGALDLHSNTRPRSIEEWQEIARAVRYMCALHGVLFGLPVALRLLWGAELPQGDNRLKIERKRMMKARTCDNVTVRRMFYPGKFEDGFCSICNTKFCSGIGVPVTQWAAGWASFKCWCDDLTWIDSHEFYRREELTSMLDVVKTSHGVRPHRSTTWEQIEELLKHLREGQTRTVGERTVDGIRKALATNMESQLKRDMGWVRSDGPRVEIIDGDGNVLHTYELKDGGNFWSF